MTILFFVTENLTPGRRRSREAHVGFRDGDASGVDDA